VTVFVRRRELLDAFRRGERSALTEVYNHYVDRIALVLRRGFRLDATSIAIPGASDSERERELLHQTFVNAFSEKARLTYDGLKPYQPYLLRIAKNLLLDDGRRMGRVILSATPHLEYDHGEPEDLALPPDEELSFRQLRATTFDYCQTLEPTLQQFVKLRFEDSQSQQIVAETLKVSRRTVRAWEEEVVEGLRRYLEKN